MRPPCGRYLWALLSVTVGAYVGTLGLAGVLLYFFHPAGAGDCSFNVSMIALTLLVGLTLSALSMSSWVRGAAFQRLLSQALPDVLIGPPVVCGRRAYPSAASMLLDALLSALLIGPPFVCGRQRPGTCPVIAMEQEEQGDVLGLGPPCRPGCAVQRASRRQD